MEQHPFNQDVSTKGYIAQRQAKYHLSETEADTLESVLRQEIEKLQQPSLTPEEIFLLATRRTAAQFETTAPSKSWKSLGWIVLFALLAGTLSRIPAWLGYSLSDSESVMIYFRNLSLFILPLTTVYFLFIQRSREPFGMKSKVIVMSAFLLSALAINLFPWNANGQTEILSAIHLPIMLWLVVGVAFLGKSWLKTGGRMEFIRYTGETFILGVLIACGLMVLLLFTLMIFSAISVDLTVVFQNYLLPYGLSLAFFITLYWTANRTSAEDNIAPVLAKVFSPLFLLSLLGFLIAMAVQGRSPFVEREFLIGFDLMLVLVLGLVTYTLSARKIESPFGYQDAVNFVLIVIALVIDGVALIEIISRLSVYGASANKIAALGENLILLADLAGYAYLTLTIWRKKRDFSALVRWQTSYLIVIGIWTAVVALVFPVLFGFN